MTITVVANIAWAGAAAWFAARRNRPVVRWAVIALAFGLLAVLVLGFLPVWRGGTWRDDLRAFANEVLVKATYITLVVGGAFTLIPLVWLACAAFKGQGDMWTFTFLPYGEVPNPDGTMRAAQPTFANFAALFGKWGFGRNLLNSFFLTATGTSISLILASLGGFALAKYQFRGKKPLMAIMLATMMIPGSVLLAPLYELICHMEMMNSYLGILVPGAVGAFGMLLFRQAMLAIPDDLLEAARIDGCSELGIYWRIVMPVVRPMSGAFCLMSFMGGWNSFLWPMIVLQSKGLFTVPIAMSQTLSLTGDMQYGLMMAGTFLGVLPPAILFFILQKEFIAGLTAGAVKG